MGGGSGRPVQHDGGGRPREAGMCRSTEEKEEHLALQEGQEAFPGRQHLT